MECHRHDSTPQVLCPPLPPPGARPVPLRFRGLGAGPLDQAGTVRPTQRPLGGSGPSLHLEFGHCLRAGVPLGGGLDLLVPRPRRAVLPPLATKPPGAPPPAPGEDDRRRAHRGIRSERTRSPLSALGPPSRGSRPLAARVFRPRYAGGRAAHGLPAGSTLPPSAGGSPGLGDGAGRRGGNRGPGLPRVHPGDR